MSYFVVATNGTGLYCREVTEYSTTVYRDRHVAEFDTYEEAAVLSLGCSMKSARSPYINCSSLSGSL